MRAFTSRPAQRAGHAQDKPKARGFIHIARHGAGPGTMYVVTYHRLKPDSRAILPQAMLAESAQSLIDMLERLGVDFRLREVRGALADVLRLGSANIPDLWLRGEKIALKGLVES
jgi:hypothetical protein